MKIETLIVFDDLDEALEKLLELLNIDKEKSVAIKIKDFNGNPSKWGADHYV